jgi:hypothetical protein
MPVPRRRHHAPNAATGLLALLAVASCAALFATKIGDIKKAPSSYEGQTVTISGKVTSTHNLLLVKYYEVDDGTGEIPVVTQSELPKEGEEVRVKGKVDQAFVLGSARLVVIVEQPPTR